MELISDDIIDAFYTKIKNHIDNRENYDYLLDSLLELNKEIPDKINELISHDHIKIDKFNKEDALKYLIENEICSNEWNEAGMYHALRDIITNKEHFFKRSELDDLLKKAENF